MGTCILGIMGILSIMCTCILGIMGIFGIMGTVGRSFFEGYKFREKKLRGNIFRVSSISFAKIGILSRPSNHACTMYIMQTYVRTYVDVD